MRAGRALRRRAAGRDQRRLQAALHRELVEHERPSDGMMYGETSGGSERLGEFWGDEMLHARPRIGFRA